MLLNRAWILRQKAAIFKLSTSLGKNCALIGQIFPQNYR